MWKLAWIDGSDNRERLADLHYGLNHTVYPKQRARSAHARDARMDALSSHGAMPPAWHICGVMRTVT